MARLFVQKVSGGVVKEFFTTEYSQDSNIALVQDNRSGLTGIEGGAPSISVTVDVEGDDNPRVNEEQTINIVASGGTWDMEFDGETLTDIPYNIEPADFEDLLETLDGIAPGDVIVTGEAGALQIEFDANLGEMDVPTITVDGGVSVTLLENVGDNDIYLRVLDASEEA
jgi:hypothetical protein